MSSMTIEISELRSMYDEKVKALAEFLKSKLKAKIELADRDVIIKFEEKERVPSRNYLRVLLRKFLYKAELREEFRVISSPERTLVIKERKLVKEAE